jgi:hypothetical protein
MPSARSAAAKLTDFNGAWRGSGTDRATPLQSSQQTNCRATIRADETSLTDEMVCDGQGGLHKTIRLAVHLSGKVISGTLTQKSSTHGADAATLEGSISGTRTANAANFQVHFGGLMPTVTVNLRLNNPSSYSIHASTFGGTLMDVSFRRAGG